MRAHLSRIQVGQEMNLRSQKNDQEHQADKAAICAVYSHVLGKTQLRGESLRGQEPRHIGTLADIGLRAKATVLRYSVSNHVKADVTCF